MHLTAAALVGYAALRTAGLFLFPMDVRGTVNSQRYALDIAATGVMSIFIVALMACGAFAGGRRFPPYHAGIAGGRRRGGRREGDANSLRR